MLTSLRGLRITLLFSVFFFLCWTVLYNRFMSRLSSTTHLTKLCPWIDVHHFDGQDGLLFGRLNYNTKWRFNSTFHKIKNSRTAFFLSYILPASTRSSSTSPIFGFFSVRSWISHMPIPLLFCVGLHWNLGNQTHTCCCH